MFFIKAHFYDRYVVQPTLDQPKQDKYHLVSLFRQKSLRVIRGGFPAVLSSGRVQKEFAKSLSRIGLLYSIFCLAMQSYTRVNEIPPEYQDNAPELAELYRIRTAQCLVIADLTRPVRV